MNNENSINNGVIKSEVKVISVGGSIICPDEVDAQFLADFSKMATQWLMAGEKRKLILVAGGGSIARKYQEALKAVECKLGDCNKDKAIERSDKTIEHNGEATERSDKATEHNGKTTEHKDEAITCNGKTIKLNDKAITSNDEADKRKSTGCDENLVAENDSSRFDWLGIMATRLNAQLLKSAFGKLCPCKVVCDPTAEINFDGRVLVAAGWKPGFSTDMDAVVLAKHFGAKVIINLSNIERVYTDDPKKNPAAKPLSKISWADFCKIVGEEWKPGLNAPFDPIASKTARSEGMKVICAKGGNIENTRAILDDKDFIGTVIE